MATHRTDRVPFVQIAAPRCDPAFDREHADFPEALRRYLRLRTRAALDAIPLRPGETPRVWWIGDLTPAMVATLRDIQGDHHRHMMAFAYACHEVTLPDGVTRKAKLTRGGKGVAYGDEEWLAFVKAEARGAQIYDEAGAFILRREEIGDLDEMDGESEIADPFSLYALPGGLTLPR